MSKPIVIGEYCSHQYTIWIDDEMVYSAGNSRFDSQCYTSANDGVGSPTMEKYCISTGEDIANEVKGEWAEVNEIDYCEHEFLEVGGK